MSDKEAVKLLVAMAVPVESLENPHNQLGLVHYLEHMILMGSRHYPELENLSELLKKHSGDRSVSAASYTSFLSDKGYTPCGRVVAILPIFHCCGIRGFNAIILTR